MIKAAFLDRDGVINRKAPEGEYVTRWEQMEFLPGVDEAIKMFNDAGFRVVVVSNQRCVAKGLITTRELEALHERMRIHFASAGARIDDIYYCPHDSEPPCDCRKPKPGMLLQAAKNLNLDLGSSWMIGDSAADLQAGRGAGCRTAWVRTEGIDQTDADISARSLLDVSRQIVLIK